MTGNLRNDTTNSSQDTENTLVSNSASRGHPSQCNNRASLQVSNNGTRDWASLSNDEELGHVDERRKSTRHQNKNPSVSWNLSPDWEAIDERDNVKQHEC